MKDRYLQFALTAGILKQTVRTGWTNFGLHDPESVAEHSFRVALLAIIFAPEYGADPGKAVQMALVHDLGEAEVGDIVTERGTTTIYDRSDKVKRERIALHDILAPLGRTDLVALYDEFEERQTPEAQLVKDLDKLEMAIQAAEYEQTDRIDLEEFIVNARHDVRHPKLKEILDHLPRLDQKKPTV